MHYRSSNLDMRFEELKYFVSFEVSFVIETLVDTNSVSQAFIKLVTGTTLKTLYPLTAVTPLQ